MASPPTFVAEYEVTYGNSTSPKTTSTFDGQSGDVLVAVVGDENDNGTDNFTYAFSGGEAPTEQTETPGGTGSECWAQTATTTLTALRTGMTVSATRSAGTAGDWFGLTVAHFRGSDGVGASTSYQHVSEPATPSLPLTTSFDNSAVVVIFLDWDATDGAARTWATINGYAPTSGNGQELTYFRNATHYTAYVAYYPDVGAAGVKTFTLNISGDWVGAAVEVRGSAAVAAGTFPTPPPAFPFTGPAAYPVARALQLLGDASGAQFPALAETAVGLDDVTAVVVLPIADTAGADDSLTVAAAVPLDDTAAVADDNNISRSADPDQAIPRQDWSLLNPGTGPHVPLLQLLGDTSGGQVIALTEDVAGDDSLTTAPAIPFTETATGADLLAAVAAVPLADTAAGADDLALAAAIPVSDTGSAADSLSVNVGSGPDAFQVSPAVAWMFVSPKASSQQNVGDTTSGLISFADTGAAADLLAVAPAVPLSETVTAADSVAPVTVAAPLSETATADDLVAVVAAAPLDETAAGADSLSVQVADQADQNQSSSVVPPMAIAPRLAATQTYGSAAGPDTANVNLDESASAADSLAIAITITLADTAAAADSMGAVAGPLLEELVAAADSLAIAVVLSLTESSTAVDNLVIGGSGVQGNVRPRGDRSSGGNAYPRGSRAIIGSGG